MSELKQFSEIPEIKSWLNGVGTELKESTREQYLIFLNRFLGSEQPAEFLKRAQQNPRETAIEIKGKLGELYKHSMSAAHGTKYALRSFLEFHEVEMHVNGKIKVRRVRSKPELSWENANNIIQETDEPYRSLLKFMLWSGLGEDEVSEIQNSPEILAKIEAQRNNDKPYIKITLSPRKSTLTDFFTLVPKQYVPAFPLKTKVLTDRGGTLIDANDIQQVWRRAARKINLWQPGLGPHQLRSSFKSQCNRCEVAYPASEFCMGHGGGDRYGYSRETLDERYLAKELTKLWEPVKPASEAKLQQAEETIKALQRLIISSPDMAERLNSLPSEERQKMQERIFGEKSTIEDIQKAMNELSRRPTR